MEFTEMEKRMLYQTEGTERYAFLQEMSMASQYAEDPARRKTSESHMEKLRPLTDVPLYQAGTRGRGIRFSSRGPITPAAQVMWKSMRRILSARNLSLPALFMLKNNSQMPPIDFLMISSIINHMI